MITTLDELRQYFEHLDTLPPSEGRQDAEAALRPVLEAFGGWEDGHLGALLLHLGMTLATQRGQRGAPADRSGNLGRGRDHMRRRHHMRGAGGETGEGEPP